MSFRQAENKVRIEGILSEIDLKYGSYTKNGEQVETIGGSVKVLVEQEINNAPVKLEVPVYMFSQKYTKKKTISPAYESIEKIMKEFVSIAAAGSAAQADKVRITKGEIRMNEFPGQKGIVSQPRIHSNFMSRAIGDFKPEATFSLEFMVSSMNRVVDSDNVEIEPAKLAINVIVPQYTAEGASVMNVDLVTLYAVSPNVINAIESYWEAGGCYKASGRLLFSSRTEEVIEEVDFGEPQHSVRTVNVSEFIVTGGSQAPLEGDFAFDIDDIKAGMAARKQRIEDMKNGKNDQSKRVPVQNGAKGKLDLGF